jgi:hypothetical protein
MAQPPTRTPADESTSDRKLIKRTRYHAVRSFDSLLNEPYQRCLFRPPAPLCAQS